jgi:hypothetical protein
MSATDILIFVEDPGAANFIAGLPARFATEGWPTEIVTAGAATEFLRDRGVACRPVADDTADILLARYKPKLVLAGTSENSRTLALPLITAAQDRGLETVGFVDMGSHANIRFRGEGDRPLAHAPAWILAPRIA